MADEGIFSTARPKALRPASLSVGAHVDGILDEDIPTIRALIKVWRDRFPGNIIKSGYYFAKYHIKDFGISIPPRILTQVHACVGWPAKAVRSLADLTVFDGYDLAADDYDVNALANRMALDTIIPEAVVSAYTHGCSFLTVTGGDDGMPVVTPRSAEYSSALWDGTHNRLAAVLTVNDANSNGAVTAWNVFLPGRFYEVVRDGRAWKAVKTDTRWPEPLAVPFISDPQLSRPLGRSRITPTLRALTDMAFRTYVRMEASAEFYSVPKLWFLGASQDAFDKDTWSNLVSSINGIPGDDEGNKPTMQQVTQASMTPHSEMLKTIAMSVAAETNLPVDSLGITLTNPTSAEAMAAAERRLTRDADRQNRLFGFQLEKLMRMCVCLRDGLSEPPESLDDLHAVFAPTREVSDGARGDFYLKVSQVNPTYATSTVGLRRLGLSSDEIESLQAATSKATAASALDMLLNGGANADNDGGREPSATGAE